MENSKSSTTKVEKRVTPETKAKIKAETKAKAHKRCGMKGCKKRLTLLDKVDGMICEVTERFYCTTHRRHEAHGCDPEALRALLVSRDLYAEARRKDRSRICTNHSLGGQGI